MTPFYRGCTITQPYIKDLQYSVATKKNLFKCLKRFTLKYLIPEYMKSIFYQKQISEIIKHKHKELTKMLFIKFCRDSQEFLGVKFRRNSQEFLETNSLN